MTEQAGDPLKWCRAELLDDALAGSGDALMGCQLELDQTTLRPVLVMPGSRRRFGRFW